MTIDNHPLTPKPVDDREAEIGDYQVLPVDREALEAIDDALGFLMDGERGIVLQAFARHREKAERGLREALKLAANRLARAALDHDVSSAKFLEVSEWGEEARKALDTRP